MDLGIHDPIGPFLRWAGSKRKILPILRTFWSASFNRYVEPFMGSASLYFELMPMRSVLGDINPELVHCYEQVRARPTTVSWHLSRFNPDADFYYQLRAEDPHDMPPARRAARLIYLTRFCFNGLYRTNKFGQFNVPYGGYRSGNIPCPNQLLRTSRQLASANLICGDFSATVDHVKRGDFVYLDPPYWVRGKRRTNQYGPKTFYHDDLQRLDEALQAINRRGAYFVLSYEDSDEAASIANKWQVQKICIRRNVAGFAKHRRQEFELLTTNISR
jgi:DNA adenine methylase